MALLSELVEICENHAVDTGPTLTVFARRLREAGRISKAGRGRGAAHMTFLDAARFLIACAATDRPERAADAEITFSSILLSKDSSTTRDGLEDWENVTHLDEALALTLERMADGTIDRLALEQYQQDYQRAPLFGPPPNYVWLIVRRGSVGAYLRLLGGHFYFHHPALMELMAVGEAGGYPAQKAIRGAYERETQRFRTGKNISAEFERSLLQAVANLIAGKA